MVGKEGVPLKMRHVSWSEAEALAEKVARQVADSGYAPDAIVAIARGGWVPARVICDILGADCALSMTIRFYASPGKAGKEPFVLQKIAKEDVAGKKVLLVDDVADTGLSLRLAVRLLKEAGAAEVRVATLHRKPGSVLVPDFFGETATDWLVYPWEVREAERSSLRKRLSQRL